MNYTDTLKGLIERDDKDSALMLMRSNSLPKNQNQKIQYKPLSGFGDVSSSKVFLILGVLSVSAFLLLKKRS
jgi:hypothetical protein